MAAPLTKHFLLNFGRNLAVKGGLKWENLCRCMGTAAQVKSTMASKYREAAAKSGKALCRTSDTDPASHNIHHEGLFYTISPEESQQWLQKGLRPHFHKLSKAFGETTLMVRRPALEVIDCLKQADYSSPVIRYILYGRDGAGKTSSMSHIMHYCGTQGWLLVHVPWGAHWNRYFQDVQLSTYNSSRVDLPLEAADWLAHFRHMNAPLLKELNPVLRGHYTWTKRDASEVGTPWLEMIDFGIARVKYACDVIGALLKEIRTQASDGQFKCLVAVDGVNGFWSQTRIKREDNRHIKYQTEELSLVHNFKKMLRNDWNGGAVVCTVDTWAYDDDYRESYMPRYLLKKEGFEFFEPHIPFHVPDYSDKELHSAIDYLSDRKWIQNPRALTDEGRREIVFLSCNNPHELYKITRTW